MEFGLFVGYSHDVRWRGGGFCTRWYGDSVSYGELGEVMSVDVSVYAENLDSVVA